MRYYSLEFNEAVDLSTQYLVRMRTQLLKSLEKYDKHDVARDITLSEIDDLDCILEAFTDYFNECEE